MAVRGKAWIGGLAALVGLAASAVALAAGVEWLQKPTPQDFIASYPPKAAAEFLGGKASIGCKANDAGALTDCKVISEEPTNYGFGEAAVALAAKIRLGLPAGASRDVIVPLRFEPPVRQPDPIFQSGDGLGAYYPAQALSQKLAGQANIECLLRPTGRLDDCRLISEAPSGAGFGKAALLMARKGFLTAGTRTASGLVPAAEDVIVTVPFKP
jgi:TonB family protein